MQKLVSVVVPVFNEEAGVKNFLEGELRPVLEKLPERTEVIVVDDGSVDNSVEVVKSCRMGERTELRLVALMKNFGKENALTAGLREAKGDAVIMIDADGQHPAPEIERMMEKWRAGAKVVTAVRSKNTTKHKLGSRIYYALMRLAGDKDIVEGEMDFRLLDREVVDAFDQFTEHNRLTRGLINWLGYRQEYIQVKTKNRTSGEPTYGFKKLMALTGDSVISTSRTPLVLFGYIGMFIMMITFFPGLFQLIQEYILGDPMHLQWGGGVAVGFLSSFLVGLVLISQSITALYISHIHAEAKNRPLYVVNKSKSVGLKNAKK